MTREMVVHFPAELEPHRGEIAYFVTNMLVKLQVNRHKGMADCEISKLVDGLRGEGDELLEALSVGSQFDTLLEAVDVANFAMLIALKVLRSDKQQFEKDRAWLRETK